MDLIGVIGGINIDIEGTPFKKIKYNDSNPGKIKISFGGVGRNISENIARIGGDCAMFSYVGTDNLSGGAVESLNSLGVNTTNIKQVPQKTPSIYMSILDETREMVLGLSDMEITDSIEPEFIDEKFEELSKCDVIVLDGNLSEEVLKYATEKLDNAKLFYDPVSARKGVRARNIIGKFYGIKPNVIEAEEILGIEIQSEDDIAYAASKFLKRGVKQVFITLNKDGVFYKDEFGEGFLRPSDDCEIVSVTGAGDSFSACIAKGMAEGLTAEEIAKMGMAASEITMESDSTVSPELSYEKVKERAKKF